ncbi:ABC transporter permease [Chelatococcus asaccharovorans]|uniref:Peptide/nickel transport system permease protein n=1 Tax=Chelatococcus asaccharovorans TaxID=28210 RepID=A0A2V3UIV0_9HYPH|nr:ABC transporter permease [Chelatococcus asaccharovorans]MBS7706266.1 ABC transporter permease [Chelatococcus asaccharovorans]PXW65096.1 peptide/nickel transport system permease protein [Chelatococcus asaccharovorans]CAH1660690.1 Glutathione transport system permease protein GsiC [Chelatococcus asaccharovorans]CAH1683709.1 Glutathione transport system permease protein GsiC [Chelatococcus asaccharovorans]
MLAYVLKRTFSVVPVFLVVLLVSFLLTHLTPGDPARVILGDTATEEEVWELRDRMGLNAPLIVQFFRYSSDLLQGDFGDSVFLKIPVTEAFLQHLAPTVSLTLLAQAVAIVIAIPFGILAAMKRGHWPDHLFSATVLVGVSIPSFWLGLLVIRFFAVQLGWLPAGGYVPMTEDPWAHLRYMILPASTLGFIQSALIARMTRSAMLEVMTQNYIRTARAKGTSRWRVILIHALRNALIPILTSIGLSLTIMISGSTITEAVFNIPGVGQLIVNAVLRRDYEVIQGAILMITVIFVLINLVVDLLYAAINPVVRLR